jgi:hypothetical protein
MKPTEFIVENSIIAQEADDMHRDHEVQMARSQMYSAAQAAIEIHRLLKDISEIEGLEGWVQSKLTLASQYLESVRDYMKYEAVSQEPEMMAFAEGADNYALDAMLSEMATGGASSSSGVAISMGGPGHKPTSGVPKKIGNAHKTKRVTVGKGVYDK